MKPMICSQKMSLFETYQKTMSAYFEAMATLRDEVCATSDHELRRRTNTLGLEAARAREDLMDHDAVHGC